MGCGESKHAVATTESISSHSKRWKSFSRKSSKTMEVKNDEINDLTKTESNNENENLANNSSQEVDKEIKKDDEKFSVNEAKSGDRSPPNTSIEEPILNENKEEEKSGGSESTQKEKEQNTENSELENANEEEANDDATPRAEKEKNIVAAMDETVGSAEN